MEFQYLPVLTNLYESFVEVVLRQTESVWWSFFHKKSALNGSLTQKSSRNLTHYDCVTGNFELRVNPC